MAETEEAANFSDKQTSYYESRKGKTVARGMPAQESFWLPPHEKVREILTKHSNPFDEFGADWSVQDILQFVFPPKYRKTQYDNACSFMQLLAENTELDGKQIGEWVKRSGASKATFYNKVLPRLKDVGLIEAKREHPQPGEKTKGPYRISLSLSFHNYLFKMAREWKRIVANARESAHKGA